MGNCGFIVGLSNVHSNGPAVPEILEWLPVSWEKGVGDKFFWSEKAKLEGKVVHGKLDYDPSYITRLIELSYRCTPS